jgi:hypothetical protein
MTSTKNRRALKAAFDPFRRVVALNEPLDIPADANLRDVIPGVWPSWGQLKTLVEVCEHILAEPKP